VEKSAQFVGRKLEIEGNFETMSKLKKLVIIYNLVECFIPDKFVFQQKLDDFEKKAISKINNLNKKENNLEKNQHQKKNNNFSPVSSKNQSQIEQSNKVVISTEDVITTDKNNFTKSDSKIVIEKNLVKSTEPNDEYKWSKRLSSYNDSDSEEYKINSSDSEFQNPCIKSQSKHRKKTKRPDPIYSEEMKIENKKQKIEKEIKEYFATREEMENIMINSNNFITVTLTCEEDKNWRMFENLVIEIVII
jgi:hypothetical protein